MFEKDTVRNMVIIVGSIFAFNSLPKLPIFGVYFEKYPAIILIIAVLLIANSKKIAEKLGGKNGK